MLWQLLKTKWMNALRSSRGLLLIAAVSGLGGGLIGNESAYARDLFRLAQSLQLDGVSESSTTYAIGIADLDGNGSQDIFQGNGFGGPNLVWLNDGQGVLTDSGLRLANSATTRSVGLGDFNGDYAIDALVTGTRLPGEGSYPGGTVLLGESLNPAGPQLQGIESVAAALGDLNGDGNPDLYAGAWSTTGASVWFGDGAGGFLNSQQPLGTSMTHDVALLDVDRDGDLDAYLATFSGLPDELWINDGAGKLFDSGQRLGGSTTTESVVAADFDADGFPDVFAAGDAGAQVLLNDGHGKLVPTGQAFGLGLSVPRLAASDFNQDGRIDVLAAVDNGPSRIWLNQGAGNFVDSGMQIGQSDGRALGLGDFNGDGRVDFVLGTEDASPTTVWYGIDPRDLNADDVVDSRDIDALAANLGKDPNVFDLDLDGKVSHTDLVYYVEHLLHTQFGDADLDGDVDLNDFGLLKANFAQPGKGWAEGDFNGNSVPDLDDFGLLKANFGRGTAGGAAAVPEPAAWSLLLAGLVLCGCRCAMKRRSSR
ncbi:MAG: VCBS repeat-containing protein [Pirellulales bacterium]